MNGRVFDERRVRLSAGMVVSAIALALIAALLAAPAQARATEYSDVPDSHWVSSEGWLSRVQELGLMHGYSGTDRFGPDDAISRAQVVTIIYRNAVPDSTASTDPAAYSGTSPFGDVPAGQYYTAAVEWCKATGVVTGYRNEAGEYYAFGPDDPVTREQLATMVGRYASWQGWDLGVCDGSKLDGLVGSGDIAGWARDGFRWCASAGLVTGSKNADGSASALPQGTATRAMGAKVFSVLVGEYLTPPDTSRSYDNSVLRDDVVKVDAQSYDYDEQGGTLSFAASAENAGKVVEGGVVVVPATRENPQGASLRVASVSAEGGVVTVTGAKPSLSEVFDKIDVCGSSGMTEAGSFTPAEGIVVKQSGGIAIQSADGAEMGAQAQDSTDYGTLVFDLSPFFDAEGVSLSVNPVVRYKFESDFGLANLDAYASVSTNPEFSVEIGGEGISKDIKLGQGNWPLPYGFGVRATLFAHFDAEGSVALFVGIEDEIGGWVKGDQAGAIKSLEIRGLDVGAGIKLTFDVRLGPKGDLAICFAGFNLLDIAGTVGVDVRNESTPRSDSFVCNERSVFPFGELTIGDTSDVFKLLDLDPITPVTYEATQLPIYGPIHYENDIEVPECTWGARTSDSDDSAENPTPVDDSASTDDSAIAVKQLSGWWSGIYHHESYGYQPVYGYIHGDTLDWYSYDPIAADVAFSSTVTITNAERFSENNVQGWRYFTSAAKDNSWAYYKVDGDNDNLPVYKTAFGYGVVDTKSYNIYSVERYGLTRVTDPAKLDVNSLAPNQQAMFKKAQELAAERAKG